MTIADAPAGALDETAESGRTALYRLYGADDELLYIGISDDPVSRMAQHAGGKPWWTAVARRTIVWYPYRTQAETAETIAIGLEQPRHNKAKRYVRLPEQAFPERASRARALVRPKPTLTEAQFADVTEQPAAPRPAITLDRFNPNWNPEWDQGFPPEWPADLWCVSYYFRTGSTGLCYEDFMRARGGQCDEFDNPTSLDFLRERAQGRKEGWDWFTSWQQHGPDGTWIACCAPYAPQRGAEFAEKADWEQQRRFLFALLRAGRCTSIQLGLSAWAAGLRDYQEARVTAWILRSIFYGPAHAARATACLEARYREPYLRRNGYRWFSEQCEVCSIYRRDSDLDANAVCSCPSYCGDGPCQATTTPR